MSGGNWDGYERRNMSHIVNLEKRIGDLEKEINQWKDRASFLRTLVLALVMSGGILAGIVDWFRTNLTVK